MKHLFRIVLFVPAIILAYIAIMSNGIVGLMLIAMGYDKAHKGDLYENND